MVSSVKSFGIAGLRGFVVEVETNLSRGIPALDIVGLGDTAVRESRKRVRAALENQGFDYPLGRIVINLAPAGQRKEGSYLDLAMAIGILAAKGLIPFACLRNVALLGELSLDGSLRRVRGLLPMLLACERESIPRCVVPAGNVAECRLVDGITVYGAENLRQVVDILQTKQFVPPPLLSEQACKPDSNTSVDSCPTEGDFSQVFGQRRAKRALEIAAAGHHNVLLLGAPGCGKSLMARCVPTILPPLTREERLEVHSIYSVAGLLEDTAWVLQERPFRAVHSGITTAALTGGGRPVMPGEITLAHHGVLFLDEITEMNRRTIESLRQPLESGYITVSRYGETVQFPALFLLVGTANPCRCGNLLEGEGKCRCTPLQIASYLSALSKPILDRIDMHLPVHSLKYAQLESGEEESSSVIRGRVQAARACQRERYKQEKITLNTQLTRNMFPRYCALDQKSKQLLERAVDDLGFSVRGYEKVVKLARTIADLAGQDRIRQENVAEALQYRWFDRRGTLLDDV